MGLSSFFCSFAFSSLLCKLLQPCTTANFSALLPLSLLLLLLVLCVLYGVVHHVPRAVLAAHISCGLRGSLIRVCLWLIEPCVQQPKGTQVLCQVLYAVQAECTHGRA